MKPEPTIFDRAAQRLAREDGGIVIEYGILIATIVLLLVTVGDTVVDAVAGFFSGIPALFP